MGKLAFILFCMHVMVHAQGLKLQDENKLVTNFWGSEKIYQSFCQLYKLPCQKGKLHLSFFFRNDNIFKIQESTVRQDIKPYVSNDFLFTFDQALELKLSIDSTKQVGVKIKMSEFTLPRGKFVRHFVNSDYGDLIAYTSVPYHDFDYYDDSANGWVDVQFYGGNSIRVTDENFSYFLNKDRERFNSIEELMQNSSIEEGDLFYRYQLMPDGVYHPVKPYLVDGHDSYREVGLEHGYGDTQENDTSQYFNNKTQLLFHFTKLWNNQNPEKFFPIFLHSFEGSIETGLSIIDFQNHSVLWGATRWQEMFHRIGDQTEFHYLGQNIDRQFHPKVELGGRAIFVLLKKFFIESVFNLGLGTHESDRYASMQFNLGLPLFKNHFQLKANTLFGITSDDNIFEHEELVSKRVALDLDVNITKRVSLNYGVFYYLTTKPFNPDYNIMTSPSEESVLFGTPEKFDVVNSHYDGRVTKYLGLSSPRALPYHQLTLRVHLGGGKK